MEKRVTLTLSVRLPSIYTKRVFLTNQAYPPSFIHALSQLVPGKKNIQSTFIQSTYQTVSKGKSKLALLGNPALKVCSPKPRRSVREAGNLLCIQAEV